jgi:hypothetical protein
MTLPFHLKKGGDISISKRRGDLSLPKDKVKPLAKKVPDTKSNQKFSMFSSTFKIQKQPTINFDLPDVKKPSIFDNIEIDSSSSGSWKD